MPVTLVTPCLKPGFPRPDFLRLKEKTNEEKFQTGIFGMLIIHDVIGSTF
jgi:hypothetical protein